MASYEFEHAYEREEIPKHFKKRESSKSKSINKAKHKHTYTECLFVDLNGNPHRGTYCKECGKVSDVHMFETEPSEYGLRMLDQDEVFAKYKKLEKINIVDIFQKYVPVNKGE